MTEAVYAEPYVVTDVDECYFYHTMEIPGLGLVEGQWDLRDGVGEYTGGVDYKGKRVLEIGTASGFLCFTLEAQGAEMVSYDLLTPRDAHVVRLAVVLGRVDGLEVTDKNRP